MRSLRTTAAAPVLAAAFALALTACSSPGGDASTATTDAKGGTAYGKCTVTGTRGEFKLDPTHGGTLTVQGDLPSPGWWNGDTVADIKDGYEYCMAANIAYRAGLDKLKVTNASFDALVAGKTKDFDLALAEISITDERRKVVTFSAPYYASNIGVMVKGDSKVTAADLANLRIGVKQGTTGADFVAQTLKPVHETSVFAGDPELAAALQAGQIDVAMTDVAIVLGQANASDGKLKVVGQFTTGESYGALYPKGSANATALDAIIKQMGDDGTLDKLATTYLGPAFGGDPKSIPVWSTK
ncbi:ABC transporter substrate-binding protein [Yinghuangia seranimata]|uniref:ABC transporter substrate-binding protein n=1 Tax=Yinghuangia seranimata TaxID=408067 RepID=UPI00248CDFC8|nr:ABC transporter substrate-binding protein [Yinghuangia seranimata]MDI2125309.1 ABC transporter substrate-binding protein [Yinghuangia seranimata]